MKNGRSLNNTYFNPHLFDVIDLDLDYSKISNS